MYWQIRIAIVAVITLFLAGAGWKCYIMGKQSVQREWDAQKSLSVIAAAELAKRQQTVADSVAESVSTESRKNKVIYRTILKEVDRVQGNCAIDPTIGMLHDSAATATMPDTSATGTNAAPVTAKDLTETVVENYESCRDSMLRLEALQAIIRQYNKEVP